MQRHVYWAQLQTCPDKIHNILTNCYDHWEKHQPLKKMSFIDIPVKLQGNRGCSSIQIKGWFKAQYLHHQLIVEELDTVNIIHLVKKNLFDSMSNFYSSIRVLLEWPFSELFLSDASLWNQYKFTFSFSLVINIFSCNISIIYRKILIITVIYKERTNELTTYVKLCQNVTIFYRR